MNTRRIRLLIWKELRQLRRDPLLLRLIFIMPVMQLLFFGYVVAADVTHLPTAIVDLDSSPASHSVVSAVEASDYFTVVDRPRSEDELRPLIDGGRVAVAIVIPEGTQARLDRGEIADVGVVVDGSDSTSSGVGAGYAAQLIGRINAERISAAGLGPALASAPGIDARLRVLYNPTMRSMNSMIPGLVAVILMISLMVIMSQAVVRERESGTLEQMFITPITPTEYLIGKVTPYALLAVGQMGLVAIIGLLWFRVPFQGNPGVVFLGLGLFMLVSIGMGLFVSLVSHTRSQAQQTVMFIMLPTMILGGFIFPIESMPAPIRPVTYVIPLRYALDIVRGASIRAAGPTELAAPILALLACALIVFGGAVVATRRRLTE